MPAPINREAERQRILDAFQDCLSEKPFDKITLRDIACKAGTPHPTVLTYFKGRKDIVLAYVDYIADRSVRQAVEWVETHRAADFQDEKTYIKGLFSNAAKFDAQSKMIYTGALNVYILAQYEPEVSKKFRQEFEKWIEALQRMLVRELGYTKPDPVVSMLMLNCLEGVCLNTYNGLLNAATYDKMLDLISEMFINYSQKS